MTAKVKQTNPGWLEKVLKRHKDMVGKQVAVGFPKQTDAASAQYPDGTPVLDVAAYNNFGTSRIPRRDFMTEGAKKANEKTRPMAKKAMKKINSGTIDAETLLNQMGAVGAAQIQLAIRNLNSPPNSPITVKMKGSSNPLVDTGLLIQTTTWNVRKA